MHKSSSNLPNITQPVEHEAGLDLGGCSRVYKSHHRARIWYLRRRQNLRYQFSWASRVAGRALESKNQSCKPIVP